MKRVFLAGDAYSDDFFELNLEEEDLSLMPFLYTASYHIARFGMEMKDEGLEGLGIYPGDILLISDFSLEPIRGRPVLIRQEGVFLVRIAVDVNPVESVLGTTRSDKPPLILPSENLRIVGVVSGVIPKENAVIERERLPIFSGSL